MMKVLFITYHFSPMLSAGTFRTLRYLKYIKCHNIEPIILTKSCNSNLTSNAHNIDNVQIYRVKEWNVKWLWYLPAGFICFIKKILAKPYDLYKLSFRFIFVDHVWGWVFPAYFKALRLIKQHNIDIIYVSAPPHSSSYIGYLLKNKTKLPYVLDMRDFWNFNLYDKNYSEFERYANLERKILSRVDQLIVTTWSDLECYRAIMNKNRVNVIYNGYDSSSNLMSLCNYTKNTFYLVYMGTWSYPFRSPDVILKALSGCYFNWCFISIGNDNECVKSIAKKYNVLNKIKIIPTVPKAKTHYYTDLASALFLTQGEFNKGQPVSAIACKTMDYLATGKQIFAQLPEGDNKQFLMQYGAQVSVVKYNDYMGLRTSLDKYYKKWRKQTSTIVENKEFLNKFHGKTLTYQLANIFNSVYREYLNSDYSVDTPVKLQNDD